MAINKSIETASGDIVEHHVFNFQFLNIGNWITVNDNGYVNANKFTKGKAVREMVSITYALSDFPTATRQMIKDALAAIETHLITLPRYAGGTKVKDNGDPIV